MNLSPHILFECLHFLVVETAYTYGTALLLLAMVKEALVDIVRTSILPKLSECGLG